jgi:ribosome-binding protein aMBF1 (putative translation factor)
MRLGATNSCGLCGTYIGWHDTTSTTVCIVCDRCYNNGQSASEQTATQAGTPAAEHLENPSAEDGA